MKKMWFFMLQVSLIWIFMCSANRAGSIHHTHLELSCLVLRDREV